MSPNDDSTGNDHSKVNEATMSHAALDRLVEERTAELKKINECLEQEIAERRQIEKAMREREEKYRTLFEDSLDAIYLTTGKNIMLEANRAALSLFGYTKEEFAGFNVRDLFVDGEDRDMIEGELVRTGFMINYEVQMRRKDGIVMDCILTSSVRRNEKGDISGYQSILRDITAEKRARWELWKEQEKRKHVVMNTAHLLHTPITIVQGNLELLKCRPDKLTSKQVDKLLGRLDEMKRLINGGLYENIDLMTVETSDGFRPALKVREGKE